MRCILSLALLAIIGCAVAADQGSAAGRMPDMTLMQPGAEHQALATVAGTWDVACTMWMDPAQPPTRSTGTAKLETILDGRYLRQDFTGEFMGQPFTGIGIEGYDRVKKAYTSTWLDSMSTGIMNMTGTSSDGGKTITYQGEFSCPMENGQVKGRTVVTHPDDSTMLVTMYATRGGKESKSMELRYTRAK
jgi:hypothetical protein